LQLVSPTDFFGSCQWIVEISIKTEEKLQNYQFLFKKPGNNDFREVLESGQMDFNIGTASACLELLLSYLMI